MTINNMTDYIILRSQDNQVIPNNSSPRQCNIIMMSAQKLFQRRITFITAGIMTLVIGIILSAVPWMDYIISKQLRLRNGSLSYHYWQRPGVIRLTKVYIFNMTNPENFLSKNEKPKLQEVGPFVYRENMEKVNVQFHNNGTVSFQHRKILHFVPEVSQKLDTKLTVLNVPLLALSTQSNSLGFLLQQTISYILNLGNHKPFISVTAADLVNGYDDTIVALAHNFYPKHKKPSTQMSLLNARNGTIKDIQTIFTGEDGMDKFGLMHRMNGLDRLPYWKDRPCANLDASEGSIFPPRYVTKNDIQYLFDKDLCRVIPLVYTRSEWRNGSYVDVFIASGDMYASPSHYPKNVCFCPGNQYCPPSGLQSIEACQYGAPIYASNPHFYNADRKVQDNFEGLHPVKEKHSTYFIIQSKLGVAMEGKVRVQMNLRIDRVPNVRALKNFPAIIFPIAWIEDGFSDLTPSITLLIFLAATLSPIISTIFTYGLMLLGGCMLVIATINEFKPVSLRRAR